MAAILYRKTDNLKNEFNNICNNNFVEYFKIGYSIIVTIFSAFIVFYMYLLKEHDLYGYNCLLPA